MITKQATHNIVYRHIGTLSIILRKIDFHRKYFTVFLYNCT